MSVMATEQQIPTKLNDHGGRPLKFRDLDEVKRIIARYFRSLAPKMVEYTDYVEQKDADGKLVVINGRVQYDVIKRKRRTEAKPPTVTGLAMALGTGRKLLIEYEERGLGENATDFDRDFRNTIKAAKDLIEAYNTEILTTGSAPAAGIIFNLKNNWGWVDKYENDGKTDNFNTNVNTNVDTAGLTDEELNAKLAKLRSSSKA